MQQLELELDTHNIHTIDPPCPECGAIYAMWCPHEGGRGVDGKRWLPLRGFITENEYQAIQEKNGLTG